MMKVTRQSAKRYSLLLSLVFALGAGAPTDVLATGAQSGKGAVLKGKAPVNKNVLKITFPRPKEFTLSTGLQVLVMEDRRLPTVLYQVRLPSGGFVEPANLPGLSSYVADLLKEGAGSRNSEQIAQSLDAMGASFFASAGYGQNVTNVGVSGLSEYSDELLSLFHDLLLVPTFPADELEKYRQRELAGLAQKRATPGFLANERMMEVLFPGHPLRITGPTEQALKALTRDDLVRFHQQFYAPKGAVLAVSGDVNPKELIPKLEKIFGAWKSTPASAPPLPEIKLATQRTVHLVNRPGSVQTNLIMGNVGISRTDPDFIPVTVMNMILGAGSSSRLFMILREEKGYTYGAYSSFQMNELPGPWNANAEVRTEVTEAALGEFITQLTRIRSEPVTERELEDAKRALTARFALSLERSQALTGRALELKRYGLPADYWDKYPDMVQKVTAAEVQRVAQKYLNPETMQIIAVGDGAKIKEGLAKVGPVVEYDTEGKRQP